MPNDEGLRQCKCGHYILVKDMKEIGSADSSEFPGMSTVPDELLPDCIAKAPSKDVEIAARLMYWRHLNHPYREQYRQHRDAEEAAIRAMWEAAHPDRRTWKNPRYSRPEGAPITYPEFRASEEQLKNMERLSELLQALQEKRNEARQIYTIELAELYREQGRFKEALKIIKSHHSPDIDTESKFMTQLINERQTAPVRFMV